MGRFLPFHRIFKASANDSRTKYHYLCLARIPDDILKILVVLLSSDQHRRFDYATSYSRTKTRTPRYKGQLTGQKPPFKLKEIWAIRVRLQINNRLRDLAMLNLLKRSRIYIKSLMQ